IPLHIVIEYIIVGSSIFLLHAFLPLFKISSVFGISRTEVGINYDIHSMRIRPVLESYICTIASIVEVSFLVPKLLNELFCRLIRHIFPTYIKLVIILIYILDLTAATCKQYAHSYGHYI